MADSNAVAQHLVRQFDRMVKRDGGTLSLLSIENACITVAYQPGAAPDCSDGACILPHVELQTLMTETLSRRDPTLSVRVLLTPPAGR